jgi:hypothetical protein
MPNNQQLNMFNGMFQQPQSQGNFNFSNTGGSSVSQSGGGMPQFGGMMPNGGLPTFNGVPLPPPGWNGAGFQQNNGGGFNSGWQSNNNQNGGGYGYGGGNQGNGNGQ